MNSRLKFAILVSSYLSVLLISFLLGFLYPFFTSYGWLLIPVVASFFVGYLAREVETATKIIIACLSLHTGVVFALVNFSSVEKAFIALPTFVSYWAVHIILGIPTAFAGVTFSELDSHIVSMVVCLARRTKLTIENLIGKVRMHACVHAIYGANGQSYRGISPRYVRENLLNSPSPIGIIKL